YKLFLGRRTLRIFPIYYLTILILLLANDPVVREYALYSVSYTFNYVYVQIPPENSISHIWSLCVEEQFYLIWPFLVLGLRSRIQVVRYVLLLIILLCHFQVYFDIIPGLAPYNVVSLLPRANSLGVGALGAVLYKQGKLNGRVFRNKYAEVAAYLLLLV